MVCFQSCADYCIPLMNVVTHCPFDLDEDQIKNMLTYGQQANIM